ncbi:hypothetical protein K5Z80_001826 [Escherichia coli]|nr:hypothetical protein [Escherichia coli]
MIIETLKMSARKRN